MTFNVNTVLAVLQWFIGLIENSAAKHQNEVDSYQDTITKLTAAKADATADLNKATTVAANLKALLA